MKSEFRVVIDSNIFISFLLGGPASKILIDAITNGQFKLLLSEFIVDEVKTTIIEKDFGRVGPDDVDRLFKTMEFHSEMIVPSHKINLCRDPKDNPILECALAGRADFLISGDKDLLIIKSIGSTSIVTLKEFIKLLRSR